jgi:hypothetical protein
MAEIFTISGAGFGQSPCPVGWAVTPKGNCGAPPAGCAVNMRVDGACRHPLAIKLQTSLVALGQALRDDQLSRVAVDGIIGEQTVRAANRALVNHLPQAAIRLRSGNLTLTQVANEADLLAGIIGADLARRGVPVTALAPRPGMVPATVPGTVPGAVSPASFEPSGKAVFALVALNAMLMTTGFVMVYYAGSSRARVPAYA